MSRGDGLPVSPRGLGRCACTIVVVAGVALAGCSSNAQTGASAFIGEHRAGAIRAAAATKAVETDVSRLSRSPTRPQLEQLARAASEGHLAVAQVQGWSVAEGAEEGEDLPLAESQVNEGAGELAKAMSVLRSSANAPDAAERTRYEGELARGRYRWNEGISQLWYLAHESDPPTV